MSLESAAQAYAGAIQEEIDRLSSLRDSVLANGNGHLDSRARPKPGEGPRTTKPKFQFSAAQKKKISDALKNRWAGIKKAQNDATKPSSKTAPAAAKAPVNKPRKASAKKPANPVPAAIE